MIEDLTQEQLIALANSTGPTPLIEEGDDADFTDAPIDSGGGRVMIDFPGDNSLTVVGVNSLAPTVPTPILSGSPKAQALVMRPAGGVRRPPVFEGAYH
jgi:hypothetical protein